MLFSIQNKRDLENISKLISFQNQIKPLRLQVILGKRIFGEDMKKAFELVIKTIKDVFEYVTRIMTETSKENKALTILNDNFLNIMNEKGILASYMMSLLSKITNSEHTSLFKLIGIFD